ncbi:hypothetical protein K457DRAFT_282524 [Linnemannia elongata AG-77]|uniref:Transmembrane protein n=1 Tax=Linnemannia elongata AG-77 TaxID=1314771 RepID=A0A197JE19_9FUNG|nr:hypothetical protein K457DRAFT_282524 [Linnemannia elongata AG-77]
MNEQERKKKNRREKRIENRKKNGMKRKLKTQVFVKVQRENGNKVRYVVHALQRWLFFFVGVTVVVVIGGVVPIVESVDVLLPFCERRRERVWCKKKVATWWGVQIDGPCCTKLLWFTKG